MNNWQPVFKDRHEYRAEIVRAILHDHDMHPVLVNKTVSVHGIGDYEVLVAPDFVIPAIKIIKEDIKFE